MRVGADLKRAPSEPSAEGNTTIPLCVPGFEARVSLSLSRSLCDCCPLLAATSPDPPSAGDLGNHSVAPHWKAVLL